MPDPPSGVLALRDRLEGLGWIDDLFVGGSAASGDHRPGVSDLDLVALTAGPVDADRRATLAWLHRDLDSGAAAGQALGCVYVDAATLSDPGRRHPTWTHGAMVVRPLTPIARAELVLFGDTVFGRSPRSVLPAVDADDIRRAARAELTGYWATAAARPWWWLDRTMIDLGLTAMARGRHALWTGTLITKTAAIDEVRAPAWLVEQVRARREGVDVRSPLIRGAWWAWRDVRRTTAAAGRAGSRD